MKMPKQNRYAELFALVFDRHYKKGLEKIEFDRGEFSEIAAENGIDLPKNLGDILYSFRYRVKMPDSITKTAKKGRMWIIVGAGIGKYVMRQVSLAAIAPQPQMVAIKLPDSTPEIISHYALGDEQALLAKVRYNRLVDIFLGVTAYSLQNHLRTTVADMGQIEVDELYVAMDETGTQFVVPVQAKGGKDAHSVVQTLQDIAWCGFKFPNLVCRAVSAQFMPHGVIALFELAMFDFEIKIVQERHYILVPGDEISETDLQGYRNFTKS